MAARRLIIVMIVLFGVSAVLASQAPQRDGDDEGDTESTAATSTTTATQPAPAATPPAAPPADAPAASVTGAPAGEANILCGDATCAEIGVDRPQIQVIPVELGESFAVIVTSRGTTDLVEIPGLGLIDSVTPFKDATFRFVADSVGDFGINLVESDRLIGRIEVRRPAAAETKGPAKPKASS
jgi:hypothetical protein